MTNMKVLNLYAGIGGNRKLWKDVNVTAVEINPNIAKIYKDFFPFDNVVVGDAHKYLTEHYNEFDFIWSNPPCQTHSKTMFWNHIKKRYPDLKLYEEILFLQNWFKGKWVVENVKSYYEPLIKPQTVDRHFFWSNFKIYPVKFGKKVRNDRGQLLNLKMKERGFMINNFHNYTGDKRQLLNNMIEPELGLHAFKCAFKTVQKTFV